MIQEVGVNFGTQWYQQIVSDILGRDLNSLLTVARLQNNILRVRLGAMQQAGGIYAVVPHTQNITVVLLVDKERVANGELVVASNTTWRDTINGGKPLPTPLNIAQDPEYHNRVNLLVKNAGVPDLSDTQYDNLTKYFQEGKYDDFMRALKESTRSDAAVAKSKLKDLLNLVGQNNEAKTTGTHQTEVQKNPIAMAVRKFTEASAKVDVDTVASMLTPDEVTSLKELSKDPDLVKGTTLANLDPRVSSIVLSNQLGGYDNKLIWAAFGSVFAESCFDRTSIALPQIPPQPNIPATSTPGALSQETMLYMFDDKKNISVTMPRLGKVPPARVYGQALFTYSDNDGNIAKFEMLSTATTATANGDGVELTFPSALERSLPKTEAKSLALFWLNDGSSTRLGEFEDVHLVPPATEIKPATKIAITDNSKFIAINANDSGSLRLYVEKYSADDNPVLLVTGARLDASDNVSVAARDKNTLKIKGTGSFTITLGNLADGAPVSLILNASAKGVNETVGDLTAKLNKK